jgi:hypothetical protein
MGDQRQDDEHLPRHCDLGHLEGDVAAMADDLGTDLDQLLANPSTPVCVRPVRPGDDLP